MAHERNTPSVAAARTEHLDDEVQRDGVVNERIRPEAPDLLDGRRRAVDGAQVRPHVEAVLHAAERAGERPAPVRKAHAQVW